MRAIIVYETTDTGRVHEEQILLHGARAVEQRIIGSIALWLYLPRKAFIDAKVKIRLSSARAERSNALERIPI